jgi:hypothetical protein
LKQAAISGKCVPIDEKRALQAVGGKNRIQSQDRVVLSGAVMRLHVTPSVGGTRRKSGSFEAFFTPNPQGSGTGLGLEIVHRIVTPKFDGMIMVESEPGNTRFIVRLPLDGPAKAESPAKPDRVDPFQVDSDNPHLA